MTHGRRQCGDSQSAEHVSLVADRPQRNHVHADLRCTRQDGDVTQGDGRNLLPRSGGRQLTLPVHEEKHNAPLTAIFKDAAGVCGRAKIIK